MRRGRFRWSFGGFASLKFICLRFTVLHLSNMLLAAAIFRAASYHQEVVHIYICLIRRSLHFVSVWCTFDYMSLESISHIFWAFLKFLVGSSCIIIQSCGKEYSERSTPTLTPVSADMFHSGIQLWFLWGSAVQWKVLSLSHNISRRSDAFHFWQDISCSKTVSAFSKS